MGDKNNITLLPVFDTVMPQLVGANCNVKVLRLVRQSQFCELLPRNSLISLQTDSYSCRHFTTVTHTTCSQQSQLRSHQLNYSEAFYNCRDN